MKFSRITSITFHVLQWKEGTLLKQGENIIDELEIALKITDDGELMHNEIEITTKQICKWVKDR